MFLASFIVGVPHVSLVLRDMGIGLRPKQASRNLDVFDWTRNVSLAGSNPVSDHCSAQHVGNELIPLAVPSEERGTGTAAAVNFEEILLLVSRDLNFVLQDAGGPEHTYNIRFFGFAEPDDDIAGILDEVSIRAVDFEFLAIAAREDFNLRSDTGFVVVQSFEREAKPVILGRALVAQQHG